jgi:hypothetical protein
MKIGVIKANELFTTVNNQQLVVTLDTDEGWQLVTLERDDVGLVSVKFQGDETTMMLHDIERDKLVFMKEIQL